MSENKENTQEPINQKLDSEPKELNKAQNVSSHVDSVFDTEKSFDFEKKDKKPLSSHLKKIKEKLQNLNVPHHIKLDSIFEEVKDAASVFAVERKTYDFVLNLNKMLIAVIAIQLILIFSLFPLKEKEPYLVGFSNATQNFVHIEKANESISANDALTRNLIGSYIINRETINHFDDEDRFETIRTQSSIKVWKIFENIVAQESSIYSNSNLTREVKIINIAKWKNGYANAEVAISLYSQGILQSQKRYRITTTYKFNEMNINFESLPRNPTGFEVQEYAVTEIATIKELEEENRVDPSTSKSRIKKKQKAKTDSNEFLREAYQYKEHKEQEKAQLSERDTNKIDTNYQTNKISPQEYTKLTESQKRKILKDELEAIRKEQEAKEQQETKKKQETQSQSNQQEGAQQNQGDSQTPNPFL